MSTEHTGRYCHHCGQQRLFLRDGANHLVHAIVTLLLCGLWLPVWIIAALSSSSWICSVCGREESPLNSPKPLNVYSIFFSGEPPRNTRAQPSDDGIGLKKAGGRLALEGRFIVKTAWPTMLAWLAAGTIWVKTAAIKITDGCHGIINYFKSPF